MKYFVENTTLFFLNASFKYSIPPFTPHILLLYTCNALVLLIPEHYMFCRNFMESYYPVIWEAELGIQRHWHYVNSGN